MLSLSTMVNKSMVFGTKQPKNTKRNRLIKRAVEKAVKDYKKTFIKLANA